MKDVNRVFREVNVSNSGQITRDEFKIGLPKLSSICSDLSEDNMNVIFDALDDNADGQISYTEFTSGSAYFLLSDQNLKQAFDALDLDQDGKINREEL